MTAKFRSKTIASAVLAVVGLAGVHAQNARAVAAPSIQAGAVTNYVIGPDDVLSVVFWQENDMSAEVVVRPDGNITVPLLNDIHASGLSPDELRQRVTDEAKKFVPDATVSVVVKQINSRKVFITGEVSKPGVYPLSGPITVIQLIATAGGLRDYADAKKILVMRKEPGRDVTLHFNYRDAMSGKNLRQNVLLQPGDTVIVP
jgi:polysaccharide export outer membrane protein